MPKINFSFHRSALCLAMLSGVVSTVFAAQAPDIEIEGPKTAWPGKTITLKAILKSANGGLPPNPQDYTTKFTLYSPGETPPQEFNDVLTADITGNTIGDYDLVFSARSKSTPTDLYVLSTRIRVDVAMPKVILRGLKISQTGNPVTYSAGIAPPWKSTEKIMKVDSAWLLDGVPVGVPNAPTVTFTPPIQQPANSTLRNSVVTHQAWVRGFEADTKVTTEFPLQVYDYVLPQMYIKAKLDSPVAPARYSLSLLPTTTDQARLMSGKRFTLAWTPPKSVIGTAKGTQYFGTFDYGNTYPFQVVFTDNLGNQGIYTTEVVVLPKSDPVLNVSLKPLLPFQRAPMSYAVRSNVTLGHPKDSIASWVTEIDGVAQPATAKAPTIVSDLDAGQHNIKFTFTSKMGATATTETTVNVSPNQAPIVSLVSKPIAKSSLVRIQAAMRDPDGRLRSIRWAVDGVPLTKFPTAIVVDMNGKASSVVSLTVKDDSEESTTTEITVAGPPPGGKF